MEFSSFVPGRTTRPLSTLIPGRIPLDSKSSQKFLPSVVDWLTVSSKRITPLMYYSRSGVVKRSSLYALLLVSLFSTLIFWNLYPIVPVLSSAAKITFPGVAILLALVISSSLKDFNPDSTISLMNL